MAKYQGNRNYTHDTPLSVGILLTNLGTPDSPTPAAVRKYLAEFLSDPRVIEIPKLLWWFVLHGIILRTRPRRSANAYTSIWTDEGSPLLVISKKQTEKIADLLRQKFDPTIKVELAMRYGVPSIQTGLEKLQRANVNRLLIFPLYPQYSAATTASTFDAVAEVLKTWRWLPEIRMINHYHDHPAYIIALANSIKHHWQQHEKAEKLLFSFHGLPKHYFLAGDPYHCECNKTASLIAEQLKLHENQWQITFQSRFGPREWLQPYTDTTLKELGAQGVKHVQVVCPGFAADCLETLEEINMQNRAFFTEAGGQQFSYIPALNDDHEHIEALCNIIIGHCRDWGHDQGDLNQRKQRAMQLGARQ